MSDKGLSNGFIFLGGILLIPAMGALLGDTTLQGTCRRYCWVYVLAKWIIGKEGRKGPLP